MDDLEIDRGERVIRLCGKIIARLTDDVDHADIDVLQEIAEKQPYDEGYDDGYEKGYDEGKAVGDDEGYDRGREYGYESGYRDGIDYNPATYEGKIQECP